MSCVVCARSRLRGVRSRSPHDVRSSDPIAKAIHQALGHGTMWRMRCPRCVQRTTKVQISKFALARDATPVVSRSVETLPHPRRSDWRGSISSIARVGHRQGSPLRTTTRRTYRLPRVSRESRHATRRGVHSFFDSLCARRVCERCVCFISHIISLFSETFTLYHKRTHGTRLGR